MLRPTALLVIDVQVDLIEGPRAVHEGPLVVERIRRLADQARAAGTPVIFVLDKDVAPVESPGWQLHPALGARADEPQLRKAYADSFYQTQLVSELERRGVRRLVVCGCTTDACVDMTSRRAVALGYDVVLVSDAHTTTDNSFMTAPQSIAYYNTMLDGFGSEDGFGAGEHEIALLSAAEVDFAAYPAADMKR